MKAPQVVVLFLSFVIATQALHCWICDNAVSNDDCTVRGRLQRCQANQEACQNEVRRGSFGILVSKRCKQAHACDNNFIQNPRAAWSPSQCNTRTPSSVCRCCCDFDECNKPSLECEERPTIQARSRHNELSCFLPQTPSNGAKECSLERVKSPAGGKIALGTECLFSCNEGFEMIGSSKSMCDRDKRREIARFNNSPPICRPTSCLNGLLAPQGGSMRCSDGKDIGSVCSFQCQEGYALIGSPSSTCRSSRTWSNDAPTCRKLICNPAHIDPVNGLVTCTDSNNYKSDCRFECESGTALVGFPLSTCLRDDRNQDIGRWSTQAPICKPILCNTLNGPPDGSIQCSGDRNVGSVCTFSCDSGFFLIGSSRLACEDDGNDDQFGVWSSRVPSCQAILCNLHVAPRDGSVRCSNGRSINSVCTFSCRTGFFMTGSSRSTCADDGNSDSLGVWSSPAPTCQDLPDEPILVKQNIAIRCLPSHTEPIGGSVSCSNGNLQGSVCQFRCNGDLELVGSSSSECNNYNDAEGVWSTPAPRCLKAITCPEQRVPINGAVSCDRAFNVNSRCSFVCEVGYNLVGANESVCRESNFDLRIGEWSSAPPTCQPIRCFPAFAAPQFGSIVCTNENFVYSSCGFFCNVGYLAKGEEFSTCGEDASWSALPPSCERVVCPVRTDGPEFGTVECTDGNFAGSECSFVCNPGYEVVGNSASICQFNGLWSGLDPVCKRLLCDIAPEPLENSVRSCTEENFLGSRCEYTCRPYYKRNGFQYSTCVASPSGPFWNNRPPSCVKIECPARSSTVPFGSVTCTDEHNAGSVCSFNCDDGYAISGEVTVMCSPEGAWSSPNPFCERLPCGPAPAPLENSVRICPDGNLFGSTCEYTCRPNYKREGNQYSTCVIGPLGLIWDNPAPACIPITCNILGPISNGEIGCSKEETVGSVCTVECNQADGYNVYPPQSDQTTCLANSTWDKPTPCCARDCPPYAVMDLVLVMDSSSSITDDNWIIMKNFVKGIIESFYISSDVSRVAVIRYNKAVDRNSQILLSDFPDDREGLLAAFDSIPYDGSGTHTGKAVKYVSDVILLPENGDRTDVKDVVLVITDGRAQDGNLLKNASQVLRERGVLTYGVGIVPPRGTLDQAQLLDIAGDESNLLIAESGFAALDEKFSLKLSDQICENRCIDDYNRLFGPAGNSSFAVEEGLSLRK